jgi:hypothetical protein
VNLVHGRPHANKQNPVVTTQNIEVNLAGPRIERCEFEQLLQRAMEILNVRDLKAQIRAKA